jgi:hypothetical protein
MRLFFFSGSDRHLCHPERSEGSLSLRMRFLAVLGMT